jgi:predicted glycosyltransferase
MKILIDIGHPAHVHFFARPIRLLQAEGHDILVTSRRKDIALELLDELGVPHEPLSAAASGLAGFARELISRDRALIRVVRRFGAERMAEIGGTFIAHASLFTRVPSLVFYDTENAVLQNAIT